MMTLSASEWMFIGAAVGWIVAACCFWFIPTLRRSTSVMILSDEELVKIGTEIREEWLYRHPEHQEAYAIAEEVRARYQADAKFSAGFPHMDTCALKNGGTECNCGLTQASGKVER